MEIKTKLALLRENPVVSWHEHIFSSDLEHEVFPEAHAAEFVRALDFLGIDKMVSSCPVTHIKRCEPALYKKANNVTYQAMQHYPGRIYGMAYVHPGYPQEALDEIERCINELGMVGVKLYYDYTMDDPIYDCIIRKCTELDVPILMHSMHCMDAPNHIRQPLASDGVHMARAAKKYPEATFIMGHFTIAEWQYSLRAIVDCPNVYTDMSGSVFARPQMEDAVRLLGADRILFASDNSLGAAVGKILGAEISEEDKKTILAGRAFERFLERADK